MATKSHADVEIAEPPKHIREPREPREPESPPVISALAAPNNIGDLLDPDAIQGTHFSGPLISGNNDDGIPGIALLHKRAKIDFTRGNFSIPVRFPPSSLVTHVVVQVQTAYPGTSPKINLGTTINGTNAANQDISAQGQFFTSVNTILGSDWTLYLSQVLGGSTAGKCTVLIFYSAPAKVIPS